MKLRLRELRIAKAWTQEELARRADVSAMTISRLERGVVNAELDTLAKLSKALGVSPRTLIVDIEEAAKPTPRRTRRKAEDEGSASAREEPEG